MKKILLFNYFIMKCVQKEQELLGVKDFKTGLLATVLSYSGMVRRYPTGCTLEHICLCHRYYLEELLLCVCVNATKNGENLFHVFDFHKACGSRGGKYSEAYIKDNELDCYLESILPSAESVKDVDFSAYKTLINFSKEDVLKKCYNISNLCAVNVDALPLPERCAETEIIDRAWERLMSDKNSKDLWSIYSRHLPNHQTQAIAYLDKAENYNILKLIS